MSKAVLRHAAAREFAQPDAPRSGAAALNCGRNDAVQAPATAWGTSPQPPQQQQRPSVAPRGGVLVTGSHRSGTTWVGRMLALARRTCYLHEPFKPGWDPPYVWTRFDTWNTYIHDGNAAAHERALARTVGMH